MTNCHVCPVPSFPPRLLHHKLSEERVLEIVCEAVEMEREFICDALSVDLVGMNSRMMSTYIDFVADRLLVSLNSFVNRSYSAAG